MRIGSLFAGIGGLDWATERALGGVTRWQLDMANAAVRRRHWPDALQVEADISTVEPDDLPPVDVLCGGFACQDLSTAGKGAGLIDGERTGLTYRHLVRFTEAIRPELVVMENVPPLLSNWREVMEEHWRRLGYGLTWVRARALDAGHPHRRARVFVVAKRGGHGRGVLDAPSGGERTGRTWPTTTATDTRASGAEGYSTESGRHSGVTLTDATRGAWGRRLNPDWTEALMGYPPGWTLPNGLALSIDPNAPAVRGRYPEDWDRTQLWPGYEWEPPRTLPDGLPVSGRPARIRGVGNAVCPQQGELAIRTAMEPAQVALPW